MPKVDAPFVDAKVSPSDVGGSAKSIAYAVAGVALLYAIIQYGIQGGSWVQQRVDSLVGVDSGSGSIQFKGDL